MLRSGCSLTTDLSRDAWEGAVTIKYGCSWLLCSVLCYDARWCGDTEVYSKTTPGMQQVECSLPNRTLSKHTCSCEFDF
jgi:hypothetical protein